MRTALASRHADHLVPDDTHHSVDICGAEAQGTGPSSHCDAQVWYWPHTLTRPRCRTTLTLTIVDHAPVAHHVG
jgi:hypothetical protein